MICYKHSTSQSDHAIISYAGTGYYYARFRPGLGSVLVFLALLTSGVQHGIAHINRRRDLERIARLQKQAKIIAYGPKGVPLEKGVKRKVRVPVNGGDPAEEAGAKNTGRMIDLMVDGTDVFVVSQLFPQYISFLLFQFVRERC